MQRDKYWLTQINCRGKMRRLVKRPNRWCPLGLATLPRRLGLGLVLPLGVVFAFWASDEVGANWSSSGNRLEAPSTRGEMPRRVPTSGIGDQRQDGKSDAGRPEASATQPDLAELYDLTKEASSAAEFTNIIEQCRGMLGEQELTQENREYVTSLMAWAHDRRGLKRAEVIQMLMEAGNTEQASLAIKKTLADYDTAIELEEDRWQTYLHRGALFAAKLASAKKPGAAKKSDYERAVADFTHVLQRKPDHLNARFNRAECLYELGQYKDALADYDATLTETPGDLQAVTGRAHTLLAMGEYGKAMEDYNLVVKLLPDQPWPMANRGDAYQEQREWKAAYEDYTGSLEIDPRPGVYRRLAWMLATCPEPDYFRPQTAVELARKAVEEGGETAPRLDALAAALAACGQFEQAKQIQQKAVALAERDAAPMRKRMARYRDGKAYLQSDNR